MVATITPPVNAFATTGLKPVALNAAQAEAEIAYMNATLVKAPAAVALVEPKLGSLDHLYSRRATARRKCGIADWCSRRK